MHVYNCIKHTHIYIHNVNLCARFNQNFSIDSVSHINKFNFFNKKLILFYQVLFINKFYSTETMKSKIKLPEYTQGEMGKFSPF